MAMEYFAKADEAVDERLGAVCERFQRLLNVVPETYHQTLRAALKVSWYDGAEFAISLFLGERREHKNERA